MNRRGVLGILAMLFTAPAAAFAKAKVKSESVLEVTYEVGSRIGRISGSFADKMAFFECWQTKLFPEWKTSKYHVERHESFQQCMRDGHDGYFWVANIYGPEPNEMADAFNHAVQYSGGTKMVRDERAAHVQFRSRYVPMSEGGGIPYSEYELATAKPVTLDEVRAVYGLKPVS